MSLATACGSTVQIRGGQIDGTGSGLDAPGAVSSSNATSASVTGMQRPAVGAPGNSSSPAGPVTGPTPGGSAPVVGVTTGPSTRSVVGAIQVGFVLSKSNAGVGSALGVSGASNGDEKGQAAAIVSAVNAAGGLAGAKVVPQYFEYDPSSSQNFDQFAAAACSFLTEDHKVAVVIDPHFFQPSFLSCLAKKGVPHIGGEGGYAGNSEVFTQYSGNVAVTTPAIEQQIEMLASSLDRQNWLTQRIGLVTYDTPTFRQGAAQLSARLSALGGRVVDTQYLPPINSVGDLAAVSSGVSNAVLRFAADGVDRVTFLEDSSYAALSFMQQSQSQGKTWRYGLSSTDSPQLLITAGAPSAQIARSVGAGWRPNFDVEAPAIPASAARTECTALMRKAQQTSAAGSAAEQIALLLCDQMTALQQIARATSGDLTVSRVLAALPEVSFTSASSFGVRFLQGRRDGVSQYRDLGYVTSCSCFRYVGPLRAL